MRRLVVITVCLVAGALVAASAFGASRGRHIQLGVGGDPARFHTLTGQHSTVRLIIMRWGQGSTPEYFANLFSTMLDEPMLGIGKGPTSQQIANGQGDGFLVALNQAVVAWGKPIYVRPLAEMNGYWNTYCAYNQNGSSRGAAYSTRAFRKAFARIYLIVHGDPDANAKLAALGMPPVNATLTEAPNVQIVWNPQGFGDPDVPGNSAQAYYPGNPYVDIVGDDLYDQRFKAEWAAAGALYKAHRHKLFAFPEWGLWGIDDPLFIRTMRAFVLSHGRTVELGYYNQGPGSIWDLGTKPRSRAAYRHSITPLGS